MRYQSTKIIELGSCCFRQPLADSRHNNTAFDSHCKRIHGYFLTAKFWFACNELDERNWVMDFGSLKNLKKILENQFDHTTVISKSDPYLAEFEHLKEIGVCDLRVMDGVGIEKFAEYCLKQAQIEVSYITRDRVWVEQVEVWEHPKNSAIVSRAVPILQPI
jgi:6-pyruvoyltetrahydropterin/6-carboxytetrahydropterin synthase